MFNPIEVDYHDNTPPSEWDEAQGKMVSSPLRMSVRRANDDVYYLRFADDAITIFITPQRLRELRDLISAALPAEVAAHA